MIIAVSVPLLNIIFIINLNHTGALISYWTCFLVSILHDPSSGMKKTKLNS